MAVAAAVETTAVETTAVMVAVATTAVMAAGGHTHLTTAQPLCARR